MGDIVNNNKNLYFFNGITKQKNKNVFKIKTKLEINDRKRES